MKCYLEKTIRSDDGVTINDLKLHSLFQSPWMLSVVNYFAQETLFSENIDFLKLAYLFKTIPDETKRKEIFLRICDQFVELDAPDQQRYSSSRDQKDQPGQSKSYNITGAVRQEPRSRPQESAVALGQDKQTVNFSSKNTELL